jgi:AcrR family transcriptional regulator
MWALPPRRGKRREGGLSAPAPARSGGTLDRPRTAPMTRAPETTAPLPGAAAAGTMLPMLSHDNTPTRIRSLRAAVEVVRAEGLGELTTRAIARQSGLTQPAIYRHFQNKEQLVREVLGEIRGRFFERLERASGAGESVDRLMATLEAFRDFAIEEPRLYDALFLQTGDGVPTPPPVERAQKGNIFGFVVERVAACCPEGPLRSSGPVAMSLSLVAHAQGMILLFRQGRFGSRERFTEAYRRSMTDLLRGMAVAGFSAG